MPKKQTKKKNKGGRPTKFNREIRDKIINAIKAGMYVESAAKYAGISKDTFYDWLDKGAKKLDPKLVEFSDAVGKAMGESELRDVLNIERAAQGAKAKYDANGVLTQQEMKPDWKASAWRLERKFPKRWGRRDTMKIEDENTDDPTTQEENLHKSIVEFVKDAEKQAASERRKNKK